MKGLVLKINSVEEMQQLAYDITQFATPSTIIALNGDLGAGKTTFTKGIGVALGIEKVINSPTFTIMKIYDVKNKIHDMNKLYHLDVYRLQNSESDFELEEYFYQGGLTVIEWADIISDLLPLNTWSIHIYRINENERRVVFTNFPDEVIKNIGEKYEIIHG